MIKAEGLEHGYADTMLFSGLSLEVNSSELVVVNGNNGSGKTTLLKILNKTIFPLKGSVNIFSVPLNSLDHSEIEWLAPTVDQMPVFSDYLRVKDNLLGLDVRDKFRLNHLLQSRNKVADGQKAKFQELAAAIGLKADYEDYVSELSYGQKKQLNLLRAIWPRSTEPKNKLILLDEPFSGLSESSIQKATMVLLKLINEGYGVIAIEHTSELSKSANRVIDMSRYS